ncbi:HAD domain-containing protein [Ralstonia pseudosolanacearum]|uniref:HAD domain-containing protein n=1 Tax=Ralstonia pseudosolanacearum TaxID=1310165 RepID=UPI0007D7E768|nr:HAD domain-containing protein [Ralstonia pseudosolanacearum]MDC6296225.1 HAD domain-containing protein [Ralstonia pseudosolanacearum]MDD7791802.1 HAD domain-containing protein [Ralstonia pseudosolanacearum]MDN3368839.1 HAD domain-containing protein [Ralstonia pseudosolanacearum]OAK92992.1 hypothetical protein AB851_02155 [Ralstonia pseudosolanacearum]QOK87894.1 hypothetical protein HF907_15340 [Ralstonia pseudosolanacearum]
MTPVLFLDYDGCLHADDVYLVDGVPVMRRDGAQIFEHANLLAELLDPYPQVEIVLSTSWVAKFSLIRTKLYLPEVLQPRVVGTTYEYRTDKLEWIELSRFDQVMRYVRGKNLQSWLALDDDNSYWPECYEQNLICPIPRLGLGEARVQTELADKLAQMCGGGY